MCVTTGPLKYLYEKGFSVRPNKGYKPRFFPKNEFFVTGHTLPVLKGLSYLILRITFLGTYPY